MCVCVLVWGDMIVSKELEYTMMVLQINTICEVKRRRDQKKRRGRHGESV